MKSSKYVREMTPYNCRSALAQRAFQDVPRSLRRRTASHDVKRVPKRLREKAAREIASDGTKPGKKVRGTRRLAMEHDRLVGKNKVTVDEGQEMSVEAVSLEGIPKLKPRVVAKGKFAHRQGTLLSSL
jgi:ribonuclease P/MRP protein subunit POP1